MHALIFHPTEPGDQPVTPEARIASLATHAYMGILISGTLSEEGMPTQEIRERFFSTMARAVMSLYSEEADGFQEICQFAKRHGLKGELLPQAVN